MALSVRVADDPRAHSRRAATRRRLVGSDRAGIGRQDHGGAGGMSRSARRGSRPSSLRSSRSQRSCSVLSGSSAFSRTLCVSADGRSPSESRWEPGAATSWARSSSVHRVDRCRPGIGNGRSVDVNARVGEPLRRRESAQSGHLRGSGRPVRPCGRPGCERAGVPDDTRQSSSGAIDLTRR